MPEAAEAPAPESIRLKLTAPARAALAGALANRPAGSGVRVWVERGMRPHAQMMLDRASVRDVPLTVEDVPLLIDAASVPFLRDAEIRYRTDVDPPGFEVVGPFLPARTAPPAASASTVPPSDVPGSGVHAESEDHVRQALKNIYDPEIPMNIVDLGLLYGFEWAP